MSQGQNLQFMINFIPNLAWSCRALHIEDETLWRSIDRIALKICSHFDLEMLTSVIPSYYEMGRMGPEQDKLFEALRE